MDDLSKQRMPPAKWLWPGFTRLEQAILTATLNVGVAIAAFQKPWEPVYGGKTFSKWMAEYQSTGDPEARQAIRKIGLDALPYLLAVFSPPSPPAPSNLRVVEKIRENWYAWRCDRLCPWEYVTETFQILGPAAHRTIPDLVTLVFTSPEPYLAIECLRGPIQDDGELFTLLFRRAPCFTKRRMLAKKIQYMAFTPKMHELVAQLTVDKDAFVRARAFELIIRSTLESCERQKVLTAALGDADSTIAKLALSRVTSCPNELFLVLPEVKALTNNLKLKTNALIALRAGKVIPKGVVNERAVFLARQVLPGDPPSPRRKRIGN